MVLATDPSVEPAPASRRSGERPPGSAPAGASGRRLSAGAAAGAATATVLVAVAVARATPLWLDEAQAVAIARLPPAELLAALRTDGAPPLYYLLLHGWMAVAGDGAVAVRALSLVAFVAAGGAAWLAGRRLGGRRAGLAALLLFTCSPFAIRYGAEARMYTLVLALSTALIALAVAPVGVPARRHRFGLAFATAALVLTHYWAAFLVVAVGAVAVLRTLRGDVRARPVVRCLAIGAVPFVAWVPSLLAQIEQTGAPWGRPPGTAVLHAAATGFAGAGTDAGALLVVVLVASLGAVAVAPHGVDGRLIPVLLAVATGVLVLGALALAVTGEGFAVRHAAPALPPALLALAVAIPALDDRRVGRALLVALPVLGLLAGAPAVLETRTQAGAIATEIAARWSEGDVVVACPDQLAPALARLLDVPVATYPTSATGGASVDWRNYRARVRSTDPWTAAQAIDQGAAGAVWLVWSPTYRGVGPQCRALRRELGELRRGERIVRRDPGVFENAELWLAVRGQ